MGRTVIGPSRRMARHQHGQAMVEFLVAAMFVLIPLFIAVAVLAKLADVRHTTTMAARYAAWKRTVWYESSDSSFNTVHDPNQKSAGEINNEVAQRLIHDRQAGAVIRATDRHATAWSAWLGERGYLLIDIDDKDSDWHAIVVSTAYHPELQQLSEPLGIPVRLHGADLNPTRSKTCLDF